MKILLLSYNVAQETKQKYTKILLPQKWTPYSLKMPKVLVENAQENKYYE